MTGREPSEPNRVASPLELFFDLVFVIAVSQASQNLHHGVSEGRALATLLGYAMVFFAIWWAWMNFTWFASAFDTDDWLYRVTTIVQMGGVLVLAAGIQSALVDGQWATVTWGYLIMRLAMVAQWIRVALSDPEQRSVALRYAIGIAAVQIIWAVRIMFATEVQFWTFWPAVFLELMVPVWAEKSRKTPWHPHHIAERYSLFVLILLGESLLASANTVIDSLNAGAHAGDVIWLALAGLVLAAGIWWIYFSQTHGERLSNVRTGFGFGYAHYVIFAAVGALSAGIEVELDVLAKSEENLPTMTGSVALTLPVFVFMIVVWAALLRPSLPITISTVFLACTAGTLAIAAFPPFTAISICIFVMIAVSALEIHRSSVLASTASD
ncbi:low temperature requirement protein A [Arthrobacter sp. GMC3]|uniref:low temperature requirement protein A n=1 Tax=Arthrobacter sp. GMC3 TaxID=2058894 RepID=UPI000CE419C3|nr:low temperature requirement protein A [Arthrobacter sp. GMC3]